MRDLSEDDKESLSNRADYDWIDDAEEAWCTIIKKDVSIPKQGVVSDPKTERSNLSDVIYDLFYGEQRDPTEDLSQSDKVPDKIEAHRELMDTENEIVTQNFYACEVKTEAKMKETMLGIANQTLDENEMIKKYLIPGTETNNSAMLFLASSLFSSNRYIFEFLNECGVFSPTSQNVVNALASDFLTQSQRLRKIIIEAELASGASIKRVLVSCVNDFVSISNQLVKALEEQENDEKSVKTVKASNCRKNSSMSVFSAIITKRHQISDSLYDFFRRTVEVENSKILSPTREAAITDMKKNTSTSKTSTNRFSKDARNTVLDDAEEFTNMLYAEVDTKRLPCGTDTNVIKSAFSRAGNRSYDKRYTKVQNDEKASDASDSMSTASSFLDFLNGTSLSAMFEENENDIQDAGEPEEHLDAIFKRMHLSSRQKKVPNDASSTIALPPSHWGHEPHRMNIQKLPAREKRRLMIEARNLARAEKKKNKKNALRKKPFERDSWKLMTKNGRKNKKQAQGKLGVLLEI